MKESQVNCIIVDDEPVAREILEGYLINNPDINLVRSCKNVKEALDIISKGKIDLILLDINMPETSGLTLAKAIDKRIKIIFTTAYREYAVDGFDIEAIDYLLKPISLERFNQAINRFFNISEINLPNNSNAIIENQQNFIFVRSERKMVKIKFEDILYIESLSDYVKIYLIKEKVITRETITNMEAKLPKSDFIRVHRSFIISIKNIEVYTNEYVKLNEKIIPISRTYKESVLKKLNNF